jgi:hypothetical protein
VSLVLQISSENYPDIEFRFSFKITRSSQPIQHGSVQTNDDDAGLSQIS